MGRARAWTEKEITYFKEAWVDPKLSSMHISRCLGRTRNALGNKARRLGIKRPVGQSGGILTAEDILFLTCFGKDFKTDCVDSCPGWLACMEKDVDYQVKHYYILNGPVGTGKAYTAAEVLRDTLATLKDAEGTFNED